MVSFTSLLATFESARARASLCAALAETEQNFADDGLDLELPVRGGGAAVGLRTLSNDAIARVLVARPVPVVTSPTVLMTEGSQERLLSVRRHLDALCATQTVLT